MGVDENNIRKVLTHEFDVNNEDVTDFDTLFNSKIIQIFSSIETGSKPLFFKYMNKSTFIKQSVTNLTINCEDQWTLIGGRANPILQALTGFSIGNQTLQLLSIEIDRSVKNSESDLPHDEVHIQIYNPSSEDIISDIMIEFMYNSANLY